ncbi:MAG: hypothetical protein ING73_14340 [Rhodocyclaceae bacterium]|nr:hypothetical protein [Rhodocyclaceae bacterium]
MAIETIDVDPTSTGTPKPVGADKIGTDYFQVVKLAVGADGSLRLIEDADGMPVKATSLPLPTGAASEATLALMKTATDSILTASLQIEAAVEALNTKTTAVNTGAIAGAVSVSNFPATQAISGNVGVIGAVEIVNDVGNPIPVNGTVTANISGAVSQSGAWSMTVLNASLPVTGTFWQATQPVSAAALPLPTGAATEATLTALNGKIPAAPATEGGNLATLVTRTPALGAAAASASSPVVVANDLIVGAAASVAAINTDLLTGVVSGWFDALAFHSVAIQVVGGASISAGAIIFEQTNDTTAAAAGNVWAVEEDTSITPTPNIAAITIAATTTRMFRAPVFARFVRVRVSTAFVGGTVQAVAAFSQMPYARSVQTVHQATAANLNVTASGTVTTNNAAGTNAIGDVGVQLRANATGAATTLKIVSAATTNATIVKASAGRVVGYQLQNTTASIVYVKLHNQATTPTAGASVFLPIAIPANGKAEYASEAGIAFATGIGLTTVTGAADSDATAVALNAIVGSIHFA